MGTEAGRKDGLSWAVVVPIAGMLLAIVMVFGFRAWRLDLPFERDEGEYAYMGQLMLQGVPPYSIAANMKLPGTYAAYAAIMRVFGESIHGVHLGYLLVNAGCVLLLFLVAKRWWGAIAGLAAAASYAMLSVSSAVDGFWAHATHFVALFALAGTLALLQWRERPRWYALFTSGFLYGMAVLMKQPGIFLAAFGAFYVFRHGGKQWRQIVRNLAVFALAAAIPLAATFLLVWRAGVFANFWFWVFRYAAEYVISTPLMEGMKALLTQAGPLVALNLVLALAAAMGLIVLWTRPTERAQAIDITVFLALSWLAVCPGLYFRKHYFVLVLPALALLIGALAQSAGPKLARSWPLWMIAGGLAFSMWMQRGYLLEWSQEDTMRQVYGMEPFPEAIPVADYIRAHTEPGDRIAVLGSEPEFYFYSGRRSATPYLYVNPIVDSNPLGSRMEEEYIDDIDQWRPKYMVYASSSESWGMTPFHAPALLTWAKPYYQEHYDVVGVADIGDDGTTYKWEAPSATYRLESPDYLLVLKRK